MKKHRTTHFMSSIYMIIFVALFLIITGRFMYIQATGEVSGVQLNEWADKQRTASYTMNSERGKIYDKNGMVLAYDRPTYRMYAILDEAYSENAEEPLHVSNAEETAKKLAPLLGVEEEEIQEPIQNGLDNNRFQVEFGKFGKQISKQVKDEIEDLNIPGINFEEEPMRYYPNGMFASHIIGFAREEEKETDEGVEHTITGVTGMEDVMNDILGGKDGYISYQRDLYNKKLLDPSEVIQLPEDGDDIYLTIDQKIQTLLEDVMTQADEKYNPTKMNAIIMDPKSGEIVAMSSRPSYDPNNPTDVENWYNDPISTPFEPGSTMKIFTWAAAIEEGVYNGSEGFKSGTYQPNEKIRAIGDHNNGEGWGTISYDEGFERSSNVAASKLLWEKLDSESYYEYLQAFGFEEPTGIDLPGEAVGKISYNWPSDKLRTAFGQSSTVTPIQQMKAASAIVNGGKMVKPYVVDKVVDSTSGDTISETEQEYVGQPISEETAEQMKKLMSSVVNGEHGTGKPYQLEDYMVGGKTGTAEIPNPDGGGYLQGRENYVFSFMGMAPIDDPQLMVYVSIQQPELEPDESGSTPLSFIFKNVVENSLHYMDINPEKNEAPDIQQMEMPDVVNKSTSEVEEEMTETGLNTIVVGEGSKVVSSSIEAGASVLPNEKVILITDEPTMPDIKGWSLREVMTLANLLDLQVESFGSGYVTTQNIDVGNPLQSGDYLGVELEGPSSTDDEEESSEEENEEETGEDESE
ncbi:penicillin-binding protein 2B (cell-division septum) [Oceanobacillus iheyensis HTE831]|uniref:serine-type D-Ala-D-Ala carboxypeptidase n=1 Tax=Oceanobacillus iheyensis (strain DSM 14371 / CIP 107618 / JCM 11309 / KCTC 3954 / HTE831) TaxID=221109 RepID=Q8CXI7_OCEIH|nr:penicillin-binding protein [Oceanobacillus iheyensis]BAC13420.1 penicillin-binding protein 2B (cell-division septum) [Oceanobacillus iheyensis HTE831]